MTQSVVSLINSDRPKKWQEMLSDLITDPKELVKVLHLDPDQRPPSLAAIAEFPLKVPRPFVAAMDKGNWQDPLLLQVWPSSQEEEQVADYVADPLQEAEYNPVPGLLHKYQGRVLLTAVPHCAIHCRYCFRRHFDYAENTPSRNQWQLALDYISQDNSIEEVILSGGDPLAASDRHLNWLVKQLESIPHLSCLRIHSRLPVVLPQRITSDLVKMLESTRLQAILVLHCNHPQEITDEVAQGLSKFETNRVTLLNQTVLLDEINNNSSILIQLSKSLFALNVLPYYLHIPDKVAGTAHFSVTREAGIQLIADMQKQLPGYLVPKLVQEEPGKPAKTRLF